MANNIVGFALALLPLLVIFVGMVQFKRNALVMGFVGAGITAFLAVLYFKTSWDAVLGACAIGVLKSLGITLAVAATMLMIFVMKASGALDVVVDWLKKLADTPEQQALLFGIGFGSFTTSIGLVTQSLFPPILVAMGFAPLAAVLISVLGYNALCSYALLGIPITLTADASQSLIATPFTSPDFAWACAIYLPVISVGLSLSMVLVVGGMQSLRKGWLAALVAGLVLSGSTLLLLKLGTPVEIVGIIASVLCMLAMVGYQRIAHGKRDLAPERQANHKMSLLRALSPWIIIVLVGLVISIPKVKLWLSDALGIATSHEIIKRGIDVVTVYGINIDLNVLSQIYTWIFIVTLVSMPILGLNLRQVAHTFGLWAKRTWKPAASSAIYFAIAYMMCYSAYAIQSGQFTKIDGFADWNINSIVGSVVAGTGALYPLLAPLLGLFGAVVAGSETSSNIMFLQIQSTAASKLGLDSQFLTIFGGHAIAGGVASAITPAKINNAVNTIAAESHLESAAMKRLIWICLALAAATGIMSFVFVALGV
ncbi:MAG: L-lactate permease [Candidatus Thermoplasmatota archaeon]|nr:L-lactate permease [Candidatus Thermoplasmatota archaeon]